MMASTYIIAEAGVNHNGSMALACELVRKAAAIGADAIKFQSFKTDEIVIPSSPKANYQNESSPDAKTQYDLLKSLELPHEAFAELQALCRQLDIDFMSTPFDLNSLDYLLSIDMGTIKISSGDLTFGPLLLKAAQSGKRVFLSTGMSDENEIQQALAVLAYGYLYPSRTPSALDEVLTAYSSEKAKALLQKNVLLLHCTSEYPAPVDEINLNAMSAIQERFSIKVGYSDHSQGILVPSLAVAKGACVIEKHITLDCSLLGPDHTASLDVEQFSEMIKQIRLTETILGSSVKQASPSELQNKPIVRRGLYAKNAIEQGQSIMADDINALRPATGISPMQYWDIIDKASHRAYKKLDKII